jgi:hypothetical protein
MIESSRKLSSYSKREREELIFQMRSLLPDVHKRGVELRRIIADAAAELEKVERRKRDILDSIDALS